MVEVPMALEHGPGVSPRLQNETGINVVALLKEPVGSTRTYALRLDAFRLDEETIAEPVSGDIKLTRLREEILVTAQLRGTAELECARCLRPYGQDFEAEFTEQYRQTVDVHTGVDLDEESEAELDEDAFVIDANHELDLAEALRQWILLALPMRPDCGDVCPGPDVTEAGEATEGDERFAALSTLLDDDEAATTQR